MAQAQVEAMKAWMKLKEENTFTTFIKNEKVEKNEKHPQTKKENISVGVTDPRLQHPPALQTIPLLPTVILTPPSNYEEEKEEGEEEEKEEEEEKKRHLNILFDDMEE